MGEPSPFVGMDVHRRDLAVAMLISEQRDPVEWRVANEQSAVRRLGQRLRREGGSQVHCVYEAGPCGYALQRQLQGLGLACDVVAPSMIPIRPGDRIKTDRRLEDLARGPRYTESVGWLRCFRGIDTITAITLLAELHDFRRFRSPSQLMACLGLVPSEYSSGPQKRRGGITRTGNRHVRRLLIEAAWHNRHKPSVSVALAERRHGQPASIIALADKAQLRLRRRYRRMEGRGKHPTKIVVAVARDLVGYLWVALTPRARALTRNS